MLIIAPWQGSRKLTAGSEIRVHCHPRGGVGDKVPVFPGDILPRITWRGPSQVLINIGSNLCASRLRAPGAILRAGAT